MKKKRYLEFIGYEDTMNIMKKYLVNAFENGDFVADDDTLSLIKDFERETKLDNLFREKMEHLKEKGFQEDELREAIKNIVKQKDKFLSEISRPPVSKVEIITKDERKVINVRSGD